jgi:hypothetical protein
MIKVTKNERSTVFPAVVQIDNSKHQLSIKGAIKLHKELGEFLAANEEGT